MTTVLHLRSGRGLYGADRALLTLASATRAPYRSIVGVLGRDPADDDLGSAAKANQLEAAHFLSDRPMDLGCAQRVTRFIHGNSVNLIHAHDFKSLAIAVVAGARARTPVVATFHGDTQASLRLRVYESMGRLLGNGTRGVVAASRVLEAHLRRWVRTTRVSFIPNGIEPRPAPDELEVVEARRALGIAPEEIVVVCIARLSPEKGQAILLDALEQMSTRPRTFLVGDGPDRAALEFRARGLPVEFLGYRRELREIYAAADLIVLPSLTEGLPLVALEAGLNARPLVATRVGELPEVLGVDAETLVNPGDATALAKAIETLCGDVELRRARGERLRDQVVQRYSAEAMARAYATRLYAPALRTSGARRSE